MLNFKKIILTAAAAQAFSVTATAAVTAGRIQEPPRMKVEQLKASDDISVLKSLLQWKADKRPKIGEIEASIRKSDLELKKMTEFEKKVQELEKKRLEKKADFILTESKARKPSKLDGLDKLQDDHVDTPVSTVTGSVSSHASTISIKTNSKPVAFPFDGVNRINCLPGLPKAPGLQPHDINFKLKIPKKSDIKPKPSKTSDRANEKEESELEKKFKELQRLERSEGRMSINESVAVHRPENVLDASYFAAKMKERKAASEGVSITSKDSDVESVKASPVSESALTGHGKKWIIKRLSDDELKIKMQQIRNKLEGETK